MKYQAVNRSGQVVKVFYSKHEARAFVHKNQEMRLWIREVA